MNSRNIHTLEFIDYSGRGDKSQNRINKKFMGKILQNNASIRCLILRNSANFGSALLEAIENHPSLEEFHVINIGIGKDECKILTKVLNASKTLKCLNLNKSVVTNHTGGGEAISNFLKYGHALEHLHLGNSDLNDNDAAKIAQALTFDTTLRKLSFTGKVRNSITSVGRRSLANVLFNTDSLDTVANSNHTCYVQTVSRISETECPHEALLDTLNRNSCPKVNRKWKVLSVLYATKGKGLGEEFKSYQNLKLIPEILAYLAISAPSCNSFNDEQYSGEEMGQSTAEEEEPTAEDSDEMLQVDNFDNFLSIESDDSYDGYDSEMEDLDDFFEDDENDEVFDKSFLDSSCVGEQARLTMVYQVLKLWGLPLLDKSPVVPMPVTEGRKQKKRRRS